MRYGFVLPGGSAREQVEQAVLADEAGWDAVFVWEAAYGVDAWTLLAAMSERTTRVRLGTMLTPLPWRRPWKVASQAATLHSLSGGRAMLAVGLGAVDTGLGSWGEETDRRLRAERLDEGIDLIKALWGGAVTFKGAHYDIDLSDSVVVEPTMRKPQDIPIWCVGAWKRPKSMRRVLRCDGVLPYVMGVDDVTPQHMRDIRAWLTDQGAAPDYDIVWEGETSADDHAAAAAQVQQWEDAGCTWWNETRWSLPHDSPERAAQIRERIEAGPPKP